MDAVTRQAFATAGGVLAASLVALAMHLEEPYWAALSAMVIANVDHESLFTKGVLRVAGTFAGVLVGYHVGQLTESQPLSQAELVGLAAGAGIYGRVRSQFGYAWFYGCLTFIIIMLYAMVQPEQLYSFAHYRCYEIVIGVICATLASWALVTDTDRGLHARMVAQAVTATPEVALHQAAVAGLGALVIIATWSWFDMPQLPQVLISSLVILDIDPMATRHRGGQRILGCIIGGAAGLVVLAIDATSFLWWATTLFAGVFLFARTHLGKTADAYVGTQSAIAYMITLVGSGPPQTISPPVERLVGIVIGVSIITVLVWAFSARKPAAR
jgi:uncharacterized membrane protein YccC